MDNLPTQLPTTTIGLIAFIAVAAGYLLYRMFEASNQRSKENVAQFVDYIEKKNGVVLKQAEAFAGTLKDVQDRFDRSLLEQGERHKEAMETFSMRMEALLPAKKKRHER